MEPYAVNLPHTFDEALDSHRSENEAKLAMRVLKTFTKGQGNRMSF